MNASRPGFDRLAPHYRWLEKVLAGGVLQRARVAHLTALDRAKRILLVGEGPGRLLAALRARRPDAAITVLDLSAAMLTEARAADPSPHTAFVQADLRTWAPPPAHWDAVVTSCVLDCFSPESLTQVIATLNRAITPDAPWLIIDFTVPPRGWKRARARLAHTLMYGSFRFVTGLEAKHLTPPDSRLAALDFELRSRQTFNHGLIQSDHWQRRANLASAVKSAEIH